MNAQQKRQYAARLADHATAFDVSPSPEHYGIFWRESAYLTPEAKKELNAEMRERKQAGAAILPGSNNKASIRTGPKDNKILTSYYTDVAMIYRGRLYKLWQGYSVTTLNHINEFLALYGYKAISKYEWINIDNGKSIKPIKATS